MNKELYNSGNGFQTSIWGPPLWHVLHLLSFNYPVEPSQTQKKNFHDFLMHLQQMLPCVYCRENYVNNLKSAGYSRSCLNNRESIARFIYKLHNEVNVMLGKPKHDKTFEQVRDLYEGFRSRCGGRTDQNRGAVEKGCLTALYGTKAECSLFITPKDTSKACSKLWVHPDCRLAPYNGGNQDNDVSRRLESNEM